MITLGIDLGGTKIAGGILRNGRLEKYNCQKTKSEAKVLEIKRQIVKIIDKIITKEVEAIGIGVPGLVDDKGVAYEAVNISAFGKVPIRKILEKRYSLPVYIDNDANCFVLGEKHFGLGKNYHNLMGVTLGTGMGTGIIIKDKLYRGKCGGAGEFGQVVYQNGVFEHYSSGQFFLRQYKKSGEEVFCEAGKGNAWAKKVFLEYGYHLGKALSMIIYAFDPEIIILGGTVAEAYKFFEKPMKQSLKDSCYKKVYKGLKIKVSRNLQSGVLGAAILVTNKTN